MSRLPLRPADAVSAQTTPLARACSAEKTVVIQPAIFPAATEEAHHLWWGRSPLRRPFCTER
ncbi:MAG TPA: hypothetical protein VFV38_14970 [Ktedonobacteraceae bacterium]|nr:hypothetical protein [Ktedonobacteraceae bacterium]